jgi:2-iminobutanoate/2-iminopropanoate deaminase
MKNIVFYGFAVVAIVALIWITYNARKLNESHNRIIQTKNAPAPIGPYSQAVMKGNALFVSGQIAIDPANNTMDTADIATETKRVMNNIAAIVAEAGMKMSDVAKTTIYLTDLSKFKTVNEVYGSFFNDGNYPARETVEVKSLPKGAHVEISVTVIRQ